MILTQKDIDRLPLEAGDLFAVRGGWPTGWLSKIFFEPETDRFHYGLIWQKTRDGRDWIIIESIGKGVAVGRLSMYLREDLKFYRPTRIDQSIRAQAPVALTSLGRQKYDYLLVIKIGYGTLKTWIMKSIMARRFVRVRAEDLPYAMNDTLICTEAADAGYMLAGAPLIPMSIPPLPCAFRQEELDGDLGEIL